MRKEVWWCTPPSSLLLLLLGLVVGATGKQSADEQQWFTSAARNCVQSETQTCSPFLITGGCLPGGLGLMLSPLSFRSFVSQDPHRRLFEKGPHLIDRRDPPYFAKCLDFSTRSIGTMLEASVAYNAHDIQPMKNTDDFRLVKRVRGKDGEWWSGGGGCNQNAKKKIKLKRHIYNLFCSENKPQEISSLCTYSLSTTN
jgi:hypothetical protein